MSYDPYSNNQPQPQQQNNNPYQASNNNDQYYDYYNQQQQDAGYGGQQQNQYGGGDQNAYGYGQGNYYGGQNSNPPAPGQWPGGYGGGSGNNNYNNYGQQYNNQQQQNQYPVSQNRPQIPPPQAPQSYGYKKQSPENLAADLRMAAQLDSDLNASKAQFGRQNNNNLYPNLGAPASSQNRQAYQQNNSNSNQFANYHQQSQQFFGSFKQNVENKVSNHVQERVKKEVHDTFQNQNNPNMHYHQDRGSHQQPLIAPSHGGQRIGGVGDHILEENETKYLPLIKCGDQKKQAAMVIANLLINPLGTFLAACFDERGFHFQFLLIGTVQFLVTLVLTMIPIIGAMLNMPNWIFGLFLICRVIYYNAKVNKEREREMDRNYRN